MKRLTCILAATLLTLLTASAGTIGEVRAETDTLTSAAEASRSRRTNRHSSVIPGAPHIQIVTGLAD